MSMKRTLSALGLAVALAAATLVSASRAQMGWGGYGPGMMNGSGFGPGMMNRGFAAGPGMMGGCPMLTVETDSRAQTFTEGRIAFLKAELAITDGQKNVWDAYASAIKNNLQSMQTMLQRMKTVVEANTPVERLDAQIEGMESRIAALKSVKPALANLYAELTADQKKKADELLTGMGCMM
jgi:hypothetical protein